MAVCLGLTLVVALFDCGHELPEFGVVRTLPVDLPARLADLEFVVVQPGLRFEPVQNSFFGDGLQDAIAAQAARRVLYLVEEVEAVENGR